MPQRYRGLYTGNGFGDATTTDDRSLEAKVGAKIQPREDGCWIYNGNPDEYGEVYDPLGEMRLEQAHRWVYRTMVGEIPDGHSLHHECGTKGCVNPNHLRPMTQSDHASLHSAGWSPSIPA